MTEVTWRWLAQWSYNTAEVQGKHATLSAMNPATDEQLAEKKQMLNDGTAEASFPWGYSGTVEWEVRGSKAGVESGHFVVHDGLSDE